MFQRSTSKINKSSSRAAQYGDDTGSARDRSDDGRSATANNQPDRPTPRFTRLRFQAD